MIDLSQYTPQHRGELEKLLHSRRWQRLLDSKLLESVRANRVTPGKPRPFIETVVDQLLEFNRDEVSKRIAQGDTDEADLFDELSRWPTNLAGRDPDISFLGMNLTSRCNFIPKCIYCNQREIDSELELSHWKRIVEEVTSNCDDGMGPYIYITGGEPLMLNEDIWGDEGLIRYATERGARVNLNTNASLLTPEIALKLINAGLGILHISLDTDDEELQNDLFGGVPKRLQRVLDGIYNMQLARELCGVSYPVIHTNCVLTNRNLDKFPQLFEFLLEKHKQTTNRDDPLFHDLFPHVIPVGGDSNDWLRPSVEEFNRFYTEIWSQVRATWDQYQADLGVAKENRGALFGFFSNPFLRVQHEGGLQAYIEAARQGKYGKLALSQKCYVAPTQAMFSPDGQQYRCGSHGIRRQFAVGNIAEDTVFDAMRGGIPVLQELPREDSCYGCALATLYINQAVESQLKKELRSMLNPAPAQTDDPAADHRSDYELID